VKPFDGAKGGNFLLGYDNTRPRRANIVNPYLEEETIQRMELLEKSLDLNPIEHIWGVLQRQTQQRVSASSITIELKVALLEEWDCIPPKKHHLFTHLKFHQTMQNCYSGNRKPHKLLIFVGSVVVS
jgi:hypothetical protein